MKKPLTERPRQVLIASSHSLFGKGLENLLMERGHSGVQVVGIVSNLEEALSAPGPAVIDVIIDPDDLPPMNLEATLRMGMD